MKLIMVKEHVMDINDVLELDYLIEQTSDGPVGVEEEPINSSSIDFINTKTAVFNPSKLGIHKLTINGEIVRVDVVDTPDSRVARYEFEEDLTNFFGGGDGDAIRSISYSPTSEIGSYSIVSNGSNSEASLGDLWNTKTFSISAWIYPRSITKKPRIVRDKKSVLGISGNFEGNNISFVVTGQSESQRVTAFTPNTNQWYHVVGTYDGTNQRLYVDNTPEGSKTVSIDPPKRRNNIKLFGNSGESVYDGLLDDLRLYDRALSPGEVSNLHTTGDIRG